MAYLTLSCFFYACRTGGTLVISTGHVTNWPSLVASYRIIPKRFCLGRESINAKTAGMIALANLQKANELDPRNGEIAFCSQADFS